RQFRMPRRGEPRQVRRVAVRARLLRVRQAGEDRYVVAQVLERFQIDRRLVIPAGLGREEVGGVEAEARGEGDEAARRRRLRRGLRESRGHRVEQRQAQRDAQSLEERAAVEVSLSDDVHDGPPYSDRKIWLPTTR